MNQCRPSLLKKPPLYNEEGLRQKTHQTPGGSGAQDSPTTYHPEAVEEEEEEAEEAVEAEEVVQEEQEEMAIREIKMIEDPGKS